MAEIGKAIANAGVAGRLLLGAGLVLADLPREAGAVHQEGTFRRVAPRICPRAHFGIKVKVVRSGTAPVRATLQQWRRQP